MDYKKDFINGAKWNTVRMIGLTITQFLSVIIIGKYISPEEYGLFGMVNVFIGLAYIFTDAGFSNAIIYKQETDINKLSSIFFMNIFVGILVCIFTIALAPVGAIFYKEPKLTKLILLTSINFIIIPFGQIFISLCKKDFKFKMVAVVDILSNIIQIIFIIIFSTLGYGVLSLIYSKIIQSLVSSILYIILGHKQYKIKIHFKIDEIREFISFGLYQLGDRFTNYLRSNVDYIIIGRFAGPTALGIYTLSYQLIMMPIQKVNPVLTDTAFPIFVRFKNDNKRLNASYYNLQKTISTIIFPIMVGIFIVAPEFILKFYGLKWLQAVSIIRIYCILSIIISLNNPIGCILNTKGRPDIGFRWNIISAIITFIFNMIGIMWGILGVTISSTLFALCISWPVDFMIRNKLTKMKAKDYFYNIKNPVIMALIMGVCVSIFKFVLLRFTSNLIIIISMCAILGGLVYIYLFKKIENQLYSAIKGKVLRTNIG